MGSMGGMSILENAWGLLQDDLRSFGLNPCQWQLSALKTGTEGFKTVQTASIRLTHLEDKTLKIKGRARLEHKADRLRVQWLGLEWTDV